MGPLCYFFGTFNPIHCGHLWIAQAALNQFGFETVLFIPAGCPPHRATERELADAGHRLAMVRLATQGQAGFAVSEIEIDRAGPTYTVETLRQLEPERFQQTGRADIPVILGMDALKHLYTWREPETLAYYCLFLQAPRPGFQPIQTVELSDKSLPLTYKLLDMPAWAISATWVRAQVALGQNLRYAVPDAVAAYIAAQQLYQSIKSVP